MAWSAEWQNTEGRDRSKFFFPKLDRPKARSLLKVQSKATYSQLIRLITGFSGLKECNFKINPRETIDPFCRHCAMGVESAIHLVTDCTGCTKTPRKIMKSNFWPNQLSQQTQLLICYYWWLGASEKPHVIIMCLLVNEL